MFNFDGKSLKDILFMYLVDNGIAKHEANWVTEYMTDQTPENWDDFVEDAQLQDGTEVPVSEIDPALHDLLYSDPTDCICTDSAAKALIECFMWLDTIYREDEDGEWVETGDRLQDIAHVSGLAMEDFNLIHEDIEGIIENWRLEFLLLHWIVDGNGRMSAEEFIGHNAYLSSEGHGTGFWDRGLGALGDEMHHIFENEFNLTSHYEPGDVDEWGFVEKWSLS